MSFRVTDARDFLPCFKKAKYKGFEAFLIITRTLPYYIPIYYTTTTTTRPSLYSSALHSTTLHCTQLDSITLHYNTLYYTTLPSTTLHYTKLHSTIQLHSDLSYRFPIFEISATALYGTTDKFKIYNINYF